MVLSKLVVGLAQVGVGEDLIGFADGLELLVCRRVVRVLVCEEGIMSAWTGWGCCCDAQELGAQTWMVNHGHLAIGLLDLQVRRRWGHAQGIVIGSINNHFALLLTILTEYAARMKTKMLLVGGGPEGKGGGYQSLLRSTNVWVTRKADWVGLYSSRPTCPPALNCPTSAQVSACCPGSPGCQAWREARLRRQLSLRSQAVYHDWAGYLCLFCPSL